MRVLILLLLTGLFTQAYTQHKVANLDCINAGCKNIASNEISKINDFVKSGKVLVLPFYSDNSGGTLSYPICIELKEALQRSAQQHGYNLTFNYLDEYNKEGNKTINHPPLDSDFDWDAYLKKFEHDYYIEGHYIVENAGGSKKLILKNINVKPNDIITKSISKLVLNNGSSIITTKDMSAVLSGIKSKVKVHIATSENMLDNEFSILKKELENLMFDNDYSTTSDALKGDYVVKARVSLERKSQPYAGANFVWVNVRLAIKDKNSTSIYTNTSEPVKGSSAISYNDAIKKAIKQLSESVKGDILENIENDLTDNIW